MSAVNVVCACGETFQRLPQRGRPAVWCPSCRQLPPNRRVQTAVPSVVVAAQSGQEPEEVTSEVGRYGEHDVLTPAQREQVEANVAEVYRKYAEEIVPNKRKLFPGKSEMDTNTACIQWQCTALTEAYTKVTPKWWVKQ